MLNFPDCSKNLRCFPSFPRYSTATGAKSRIRKRGFGFPIPNGLKIWRVLKKSGVISANVRLVSIRRVFALVEMTPCFSISFCSIVPLNASKFSARIVKPAA
jgi:hypothetical protein